MKKFMGNIRGSDKVNNVVLNVIMAITFYYNIII